MWISEMFKEGAWTPYNQAIWEEEVKEGSTENTLSRLDREGSKSATLHKMRLANEWQSACAQRTRSAYSRFVRNTPKEEKSKLLLDELTGLYLVQPVPEWWWEFIDWGRYETFPRESDSDSDYKTNRGGGRNRIRRLHSIERDSRY